MSVGEQAIKFLSTPSARRATKALERELTWTKISIHALREEGDARAGINEEDYTYFYPRPPRGGRLLAGTICGG